MTRMAAISSTILTRETFTTSQMEPRRGQCSISPPPPRQTGLPTAPHSRSTQRQLVETGVGTVQIGSHGRVLFIRHPPLTYIVRYSPISTPSNSTPYLVLATRPVRSIRPTR